jgi:sterol desaturase/sphingolipid hydroxylase (fatty acid hydroxylase superfamily)
MRAEPEQRLLLCLNGTFTKSYMSFLQTLVSSVKGSFPGVVYWLLLPLIPFIIAEQIRPVGKAPRIRDYWLNILISLSTAYMSLPLGIAAGLWSSKLRQLLPWKPLSFSFHRLGAVPIIGSGLEVLALIFVPLFIHDCWFYWSHRIEHRVSLLWEFHKIHHSDELMNTTTWARDHFLQEGWRAFFSVFTLGLFIDLKMHEAGKAALYSTMFLVGLSMFYHSAIRIALPWLDYIVVTPQVHRIHHSVRAEHQNRNFADVLPIFDLVFGTFERPKREEFPATGLGSESPAPRSLLVAQFGPLLAVTRLLRFANRKAADLGSASG